MSLKNVRIHLNQITNWVAFDCILLIFHVFFKKIPSVRGFMEILSALRNFLRENWRTPWSIFFCFCHFAFSTR